jgi:type II secretion system protein H
MMRARSASGFTLVELIIVMTLLAIVAALSVPSLSRSMRQRNLDEEATRLLALTEYGRDEAVSQGVPMILWIDAQSQRYGVEPKAGFDSDDTRARDYEMNPDVRVEIDKAGATGGIVEAMEFEPDGALANSSVDAVRLVDRFDSAISISRTTDGWSYEIVKEEK